LPAGADPLAAGQAREGRFHCKGQTAIHGSLTPEGCAVAIRRNLRADDPPPVVVSLQINAPAVLDMRRIWCFRPRRDLQRRASTGLSVKSLKEMRPQRCRNAENPPRLRQNGSILAFSSLSCGALA
jgi:hypothetical protein